MGLLDGLLGTSMDDPRTMGLLALSAGLIKGDMGAGLLGFGQAYTGAQDSQMKRKLTQAQLENYQSEVAQRNAQLEALKRKQAALPSLFQQPPTNAENGQLGSGTFGIQQPPAGQPDIKPSGMPQFNPMAALQAGYTPDEIQKLAALRNVNLDKVARTVKAIGPDGREYEYQMDDFGRPVGAPMAQYRAPMSVDQGNKQTFVDPYTLKPVGGFQKFQSPDSAASVAATLRGQNMTDARAREQIQLGKVPAGYRQNPDGTLMYIPGGPADPAAAKRAAPTEFQGKSATFGARALEADKILNTIGTDYSPIGVNTKNALGRTPLVGGALEAGANWTLSDNSQKADQAQRDFVNAVLRQESGAAISAGEFENARRQYFPQPGDSPAVIAQKARNRRIAINGFRENARPGAVDEVLGAGFANGASGASGATVDPNDPLGLRR